MVAWLVVPLLRTGTQAALVAHAPTNFLMPSLAVDRKVPLV
jgi:hypothetical protein